MIPVEGTQANVVELVVVFAGEAFPALVVLPDPLLEALLDFLLLVAGGLGGRGVNDIAVAVRVVIIDGGGAETLETKARFIGQVMTGESDLRRIEDIDGTALTYAEVKAIASGNPLVIEKARVDAELARLGRLRCQHEETRFKLRSRIRHFTAEIPVLEHRHEAARRDLVARLDTSGENFCATIDGQDIRDRGVAGELLIRHAGRLRGSQAERQVGSIAGFRLFVADNLFRGPEIVIKGAGAYTANVNDTALGTIRSVEHTIQHLDETAANLAQNLTDTRKRLVDTQAQVEAPFEYAERLASLARRQQEIEDELDLTKSQATSGLDAQPDTPSAEGDTPTSPEVEDPGLS